ncbi:MAG: DUF547 domain-containing protein [Azospirillum sp.]|nr:DUF547 domain-containing protein [Azospirillum sp.]
MGTTPSTPEPARPEQPGGKHRGGVLSRRSVLVVPAAWGLLSATVRPAAAAPRAELWPRWTAQDPASRLTVDHTPWQRLLASYLITGGDGINRFAYRRVTPADRAALAAWLGQMARVAVARLSRSQQFAFWVNLYNALTVKLVLDHYPVRSIRDIDISPGWFAVGPWGAQLATVDGEALSLDDIEHRILRPIWSDPRIHYAVNCASLGCPNLAAEVYDGATLERQLDRGAHDYVNHPRGAALTDGGLVVSSLYRWYRDDFGGDDGVIAHLRRWASPAFGQRLAGIAEIADHHYDWSLNQA